MDLELAISICCLLGFLCQSVVTEASCVMAASTQGHSRCRRASAKSITVHRVCRLLLLLSLHYARLGLNHTARLTEARSNHTEGLQEDVQGEFPPVFTHPITPGSHTTVHRIVKPNPNSSSKSTFAEMTTNAPAERAPVALARRRPRRRTTV